MRKSLPWQSVAYWTKAKLLWVAYKVSRDFTLLAQSPYLLACDPAYRLCSQHITFPCSWKYGVHSYHHVFAHVHLGSGEPSTFELIIAFSIDLPWWCSRSWVVTLLAPFPIFICITCICFRIIFSNPWVLKHGNYKLFIFIYSQFNTVGVQWMFVE